MKVFVNFFIAFILYIILSLYWEARSSEVIYVESYLDGNKYLVRNLPDKEAAANNIAMIRLKLTTLIEHLKSSNGTDERVKRLCDKFNEDVLSEAPKNSKYTSYTVNKGEKMFFCLRQRDERNNLVDLNTVTFVALHELAHVMTKSIDHTKEFWNNFKYLLKEAIALGLYEYQPFHQKPVTYCGTMISDTPLK